MSIKSDASQPAARVFEPFFIVGFERSGTTLLSVLLSRHSRLAVAMETHFLLKVAPRRQAAAPGNHAALLSRLDACERVADLQLDRTELRQRFATMDPTYQNLLRAVLETYGAAQKKERTGEKTPFHLWEVPRIFEWYAEAKVVCIIRDGRDAVTSLLKMPWAPHHFTRMHSLSWVKSVRAALRFQDHYHGRFLLVRYEDLVTSPRQEMARIDDFLGVPFEEQQLAPGVAPGVIPANWRAWLDRSAGEIDPSRIGLWRHGASARQRRIMNSMMRPTLRQLGYDESEPGGMSLALHLYHMGANWLCHLQLHRLIFNVFLRQKARRDRQVRLQNVHG